MNTRARRYKTQKGEDEDTDRGNNTKKLEDYNEHRKIRRKGRQT